MGRTCLGLIALIVGLPAACTSDDGTGNARPRSTAGSAIQTESFELPVIHDFGVSQATPDTKLTGVNEPAIQVGHGRVAILAVQRPPISANCLVAAQLRLYLRDQTERVAGELAIYPSHVFNATEKREGDEYGYSGSALDIRPRATLDEATAGWSRWDVTDIVKLWLGHGVFPSQGARVPKRGPIVLALRDVDGAQPFATATVLSADAPNNTPHLVATRRKGCAAA